MLRWRIRRVRGYPSSLRAERQFATTTTTPRVILPARRGFRKSNNAARARARRRGRFILTMAVASSDEDAEIAERLAALRERLTEVSSFTKHARESLTPARLQRARDEASSLFRTRREDAASPTGVGRDARVARCTSSPWTPHLAPARVRRVPTSLRSRPSAATFAPRALAQTTTTVITDTPRGARRTRNHATIITSPTSTSTPTPTVTRPSRWAWTTTTTATTTTLAATTRSPPPSPPAAASRPGRGPVDPVSAVPASAAQSILDRDRLCARGSRRGTRRSRGGGKTRALWRRAWTSSAQLFEFRQSATADSAADDYDASRRARATLAETTRARGGDAGDGRGGVQKIDFGGALGGRPRARRKEARPLSLIRPLSQTVFRSFSERSAAAEARAAAKKRAAAEVRTRGGGGGRRAGIRVGDGGGCPAPSEHPVRARFGNAEKVNDAAVAAVGEDEAEREKRHARRSASSTP